MYPNAKILPRKGMRLSDFETNVKSIISSKRAIALISQDRGLELGVEVEDELVVG
jgi:hypothetical protein